MFKNARFKVTPLALLALVAVPAFSVQANEARPLLMAQANTSAPAADTPSLPGGASALQESFDDWQVGCSTASGQKRCSLVQQQIDSSSKQRVLAVEVTDVSANKAKGVVALPFGLLLSRGVTLQIDTNPALPTLEIRTCLPAGCMAAFDLDAKLIAALKSGKMLNVKAVSEPGQEVGFNLSLKGFGRGFDRTAQLLN